MLSCSIYSIAVFSWPDSSIFLQCAMLVSVFSTLSHYWMTFLNYIPLLQPCPTLLIPCFLSSFKLFPADCCWYPVAIHGCHPFTLQNQPSKCLSLYGIKASFGQQNFIMIADFHPKNLIMIADFHHQHTCYQVLPHPLWWIPLSLGCTRSICHNHR